MSQVLMMAGDEAIDFLRLKKNLKKDFSNFPSCKVAILGDSSTQMLHQAIRGYGYEVGLNLDIYEADYDQIEQEAYDAASEIHNFKPSYTFIFQSTQKLIEEFYVLPEEHKVKFAASHIESLRKLFQTLTANLETKIIYANFIEINDTVFGNYANKVESSFLFQLRKLNFELMNLALSQRNLFINDVLALAGQVGMQFYFDPKLYITADIIYSLDFAAKVAKNSVDILLPSIGRMKKCLVLDLDNTLWGGVIGDDGLEKIQIGELGSGKAFGELQSWAKQLKLRGIILAVCSKNTEDIAKEPFEKHPDMVLRLEDISVFVANWESKVDNLRRIQSVLGIGFDSMVFLDDNEYERGLVRSVIPEITVPDLPEDPAEFLPYLRSLNLFETASFSEEDLERTRQYKEEAQRTILKQTHHSEEDYLRDLGMVAEVREFNRFTTPRVAQLTQRSNQFNLRTIRYSEEDIVRISASPAFRTLSFNLKDRFGEHGLISAIILKKEEDTFFIDTWVMSCRVLKRGMEYFIVDQIVKLAKREGVSKIIGQYIATPKNEIVRDLYSALQFKAEKDLWTLNVPTYTNHKTHIDATY